MKSKNKRNNIIANVLIDSVYKDKHINGMKYEAKDFPLLHNKLFFDSNLKFDSDWNYLMEAVRVIKPKLDIYNRTRLDEALKTANKVVIFNRLVECIEFGGL